MIKVNLLKPKITIYDDSNPGGIIDIQKLKTTYVIKPCLYEVFWDKESFIECMGETKKDREG